MFNNLKTYCKNTVSLTEDELKLIDLYFESKTLKKKEFLLQDNTICNFLGFVSKGSIRHFHMKDGAEKTCDISFENSWVTDFQSFNNKSLCVMNLQAIEDTTIFTISKENLAKLYKECNTYETFGRLMIEQIVQNATDIVMSLSSEKPEERFQKLVKNRPDMLQRVPQKYVANFLGISPESLSRIRRRIIENEKS